MRTFGLYQRGIAALLSVLMVYATNGVSFAQTAAALPYSGQTIFRGVLLGDGPVAKLFPEIWESPTVAAQVQRAAQEKSAEEIAAGKQQIIDLLNAQDPTFFDRFGTEMQSGDRIRIEQALTEAGTRMKQALNKLASRPSTDVIPVYLYFAVAIAVVVAVAVAVLAFLVVEDKGNPASSSLERDVYVDLIAQRLHSAIAR